MDRWPSCQLAFSTAEAAVQIIPIRQQELGLLCGRCGAHGRCHDGLTDTLYLLVPAGARPQFALSYAPIGLWRALYTA